MTVLYLGTSPTSEVRHALDTHKIGFMCAPKAPFARPGWIWAADNGCYTAAWNEENWLRWLHRSEHPHSGCLFATVPDVVADHKATLARWERYAPLVAEARFPLAFVGQNGATEATIPWDEFDAFFVGGDTAWKMGPAFALALTAHEKGKWVHVGRVNSDRRFLPWSTFADSCDGTFIAFGPSKNLPQVLDWIEHSDSELSLWGRT